MKTYLITLIVCLPAAFCVNAQSFRYDTVAAPNSGQEKKLYRYEQPVQQQTRTTQSQARPVEAPKLSTKSGFDKSKLEIGGSFGMVFGDYTTLNISPQIGYAFSKYFSAGVGIGYSYYKYDQHPRDITYNYLGANVYGRFNPIRYLNLQVQPEVYYAWGSALESQAVPCLLVGGGFTVPAGRGGINMMIYYDVVQYKSDGYNISPYGNQVFYSVGYVFSF